MEVLTAEDLADNQIVDLRDLQNEIPNLSISSNDGNDFTTLTIRGIGSTQAASPNVVNGSSFIQDGISNNLYQGNNLNLFDIGSVEVLRGPQGTFIGSNSSGGAVVVTSARPDFDGFSGYVEGTIGSYDRLKLSGAVNIPLTDTFAARLAFNKEDRDSYFGVEGILFSGYAPPPLV